MPVYLDEKDEREEFIKELIDKVGYDSSDFAGYIYMDMQGLSIDNHYADYKKMIDAVAEKFPTTEPGVLVEEISKIMRDEESEWIELWSKDPENQITVPKDEDGHYYW